MDQLGKILNEDERVIEKVHQHPVIYFWSILLSLLLFLSPFFILYPLFGLGQWGIIIFLFLTILGILLAVRSFIFWYNNFTLITDKRIIFFSKKRLFDKKVFDVELHAVNESSLYRPNLWAGIFGFANIKLSVTYEGSSRKKMLYFIPDAEEFSKNLLNLAKEAKNLQKPKFLTAEKIIEKTPMTELFRAIRQIRDKLGEDKFIETLNKSED